MQVEINRLQEQNARLSTLLESERRNAKRSRDDMIKKVSSLLVDFSEERDRTLREAVHGVKESNEITMQALTTQRDDHSEGVDAAVARGQVFSDALDAMSEGKEEARIQAISVSLSYVCSGTWGADHAQSLHGAQSSLQDGVRKIQGATTSSLRSHGDDMTKQAHALGSYSKGKLDLAGVVQLLIFPMQCLIVNKVLNARGWRRRINFR